MLMTRPGWIRLQSLHVDGVRVGIYPHEKDGRQSIVIDIGMFTDFGRAVASERIQDTVDYDAVAALARDLSRARYFPLVEALAEELAQAVLARFPVQRVTIEVHKPGALAPGSVSVAIERQR